MDAWNTTFLFEAMFGCICQAARRKKLAVVDETSNLLVCERRFPGRFPHVWPNIRRWFISTSIFFLNSRLFPGKNVALGWVGPQRKTLRRVNGRPILSGNQSWCKSCGWNCWWICIPRKGVWSCELQGCHHETMHVVFVLEMLKLSFFLRFQASLCFNVDMLINCLSICLRIFIIQNWLWLQLDNVRCRRNTSWLSRYDLDTQQLLYQERADGTMGADIKLDQGQWYEAQSIHIYIFTYA